MHYGVSHPGELIYKCKLCGKGFYSKSGLHRHSKLHEDAVNTCEYCRKEFAVCLLFFLFFISVWLRVAGLNGGFFAEQRFV